MPTTSPVTGTSTDSQAYATTSDLAASLDSDTFLELLITEIQNQDPMEPMTNAEICEQLGQIWELQSNMELSDTLDSLSSTLQSVVLAQNLASANSMIGRVAVGETEEDGEIAGYVNGVTVEDGQIKVYVGDYTCDLENISEVLDESLLETYTDSESEEETEEAPEGAEG